MTSQDASEGAGVALAPAEPGQRPSARQFFWYSYGGSLPPRYSAWVLHDVTCRTWWVRHFVRVLLVMVPLSAAYLLIVPASAGAARFTGITAALGIVLLSVILMLVDTDRRAVRAGYLASLPSVMRSQRSVDAQRLGNYQRRERIARRRAMRNRRY